MDKDRVAGSAKKAIGKVTGDSKTQAEGVAKKTIGRTQNAGGGTKDTLRKATKPR